MQFSLKGTTLLLPTYETTREARKTVDVALKVCDVTHTRTRSDFLKSVTLQVLCACAE